MKFKVGDIIICKNKYYFNKKIKITEVYSSKNNVCRWCEHINKKHGGFFVKAKILDGPDCAFTFCPDHCVLPIEYGKSHLPEFL